MLIIVFASGSSSASAQGASKLRKGDRIYVNVVGEEISGFYDISESGSFQMPYLEDPIPAAGKTPAQLQEVLLNILKPDYLINPQIIVTLKDKRESSCWVTGQVGSARLIPFDPDKGLTLQEALGQAGGLAPGADSSRVEVIRSGKTIAAPMPASRTIRLTDGDSVNVPMLPQLGTYSLSGHVRKAGTFQIPREGRKSLMWAIENGGGIADTGTVRRIELRRAGKIRQFKSEEALELEAVLPGDLIKVGRRAF